MSRLVRQRARLARVRRVQHNLAAGAAARAAAEVQRLEASVTRLAQLRDGLAAAEGLATGATLASLGELALRLDGARAGLAPSISRARTAADRREAERLEAHRNEESADKLEQRALATAERLADLKAQARFRLRPRKTSGDYA